MTKELGSADVVIMAGGRGRRLGTITNDKQKCLLVVDEKPILGHVLDAVSEAFGSTNVTLCVAYKAGDVIEYVDGNAPGGLRVQYVHDEGLSKSADIYRSLDGKVKTPFLAAAGDVIVESRLFAQTYETILEQSALATVAFSPKIDEADTHPVGKIRDGRVTEFQSIPPAHPDQDHLREMNIRGIGADFCKYISHHTSVGDITHIIRLAVEDQQYISGILYEGRWVHVAYPSDLQKSMK